MPYNFAADSFHTKKLCSRLSSSEVNFFNENRRFCVFEVPFGGLRGNVRRSSQAHWKARSGLPISVNWTFFARCYGWGATSDYWLISLQRGSVDPKFYVEGVAPPTNHSSSQKTRINVLSYGIKIWIDLSTVLSGITRVTDRQTDRILITIPCLHYMQRGNEI